MRDSRLEELISAYVDGELSSDERLLVERQLEQSGDSRQLLEQLWRQRRMLQSVPRSRLPGDFSDKIVHLLDDSKTVRPSIETCEARTTSPRRLALNILLGIGSVLAAGLLISMVLRDTQVEKNPLQPPRNDFVVEPNVVDPEIRLAAFQKKFQFLLVYDLAITPKGRQNKILDQWLKAAGIHVEKSLTIEEKLEAGLLESRYLAKNLVPVVGGTKDISETDVEMILIRAPASQIDNLSRQWGNVRGAAQDEIHMNMDMAMSTKDLEIFLHLNDAVDGDGVVRQVSSDSWTTPGTYKLKFRYAFNKRSNPRVSTTAASSPNIQLLVNVENKAQQPEGKQLEKQQLVVVPGTESNVALNDANNPSQVLIIVRNLNEDVLFPATKGTPAND